MCMYSTVRLSPEQTQIWSGSGLRQYWCFGDCHEQPQNDKCFPHPLLSASKQLAILSDLHVSYPILCDPNHLGHEQMGSAAGVWVSDCDQKPTEWFNPRTSQCSSLKSVNSIQVLILSGEVSMETEAGVGGGRQELPGADTSRSDVECRATGRRCWGVAERL